MESMIPIKSINHVAPLNQKGYVKVINSSLFIALAMACLLGALWSVFPEEMIPNHNLFGLVVTIILCMAAETLVVKVPTPEGFPPIPPLFGTLELHFTKKFLCKNSSLKLTKDITPGGSKCSAGALHCQLSCT